MGIRAWIGADSALIFEFAAPSQGRQHQAHLLLRCDGAIRIVARQGETIKEIRSFNGGKNLGAETASTMGRQRSTNYALQPMPRDEFIRIITAGQPDAPRYFSHDARFNRVKHDLLQTIVTRSMTALSADQVLKLQKTGVTVLDVRSPSDFAVSHLVGSVNVGLDGRFASWAGTVLPPTGEIIIVADPGAVRGVQPVPGRGDLGVVGAGPQQVGGDRPQRVAGTDHHLPGA